MKRICSLMLLLIPLSCDPPEHSYITFNNRSNQTIFVGWGLSYPQDSTRVIDLMIRSDHYDEIAPYSKRDLWHGTEKIESWVSCFDRSHAGYLSFYIMDNEVRNMRDIENILKDYRILARYDLTEDDLATLDWTLSYPPTPEMSHIHMWLKQ